MAQQTALTALGTPGRTQSFSAKEPQDTGPHAPGEIIALSMMATPGQLPSFTAKTAAEPEVGRVATEKGRGEEEFFPRKEMVSPLDYRRGWKEHIRAAEASMWAKQRGVEEARKFKITKQEREIKVHKSQGVQTPKREKSQKPEPVNRLEVTRKEQQESHQTLEIQPSEKRIVRPDKRTVRRTDERLEASNKRATEVREENRFQAHLKATEGLVKSQNVKEEKRQREAEKDIGYKPTQIKRDRADRAKLYEQRTQALVNLEKAKRAKVQLQDVEALRQKQRLAALKKARAAKKRKKKGKKK